MSKTSQAVSTLPITGVPGPNFHSIHEAGACRHGFSWLQANRRAMKVLWGSRKLRPDDSEVKRITSLIVLRVLDGLHADQGESWNDATGVWSKTDD